MKAKLSAEVGRRIAVEANNTTLKEKLKASEEQVERLTTDRDAEFKLRRAAERELREANEKIRLLKANLAWKEEQHQATQQDAVRREQAHWEERANLEKAYEELRVRYEKELDLVKEQLRATQQDVEHREAKHQKELANLEEIGKVSMSELVLCVR